MNARDIERAHYVLQAAQINESTIHVFQFFIVREQAH